MNCLIQRTLFDTIVRWDHTSDRITRRKVESNSNGGGDNHVKKQVKITLSLVFFMAANMLVWNSSSVISRMRQGCKLLFSNQKETIHRQQNMTAEASGWMKICAALLFASEFVSCGSRHRDGATVGFTKWKKGAPNNAYEQNFVQFPTSQILRNFSNSNRDDVLQFRNAKQFPNRTFQTHKPDALT